MIRRLFSALVAVLLIQPVAADPLIDAFPYPLVAVKGSKAFEEWQALRSKEGTPIILGGQESVERVLDYFQFMSEQVDDPLEVTLDKGNTHQYPNALYEFRIREHQQLVDSLLKNGSEMAQDIAQLDPVQIPDEYWGEWPDTVEKQKRLISLNHWETGLPPDVVYIAILPTEDPWEAPAYLRFGGWNSNPAPDVHVAAFRKWTTEFGAVPVVIQADVIEMYVESPPSGREAARALAKVQYLYCDDIVHQGVGDLSTLAAMLEGANFWYFWWD